MRIPAARTALAAFAASAVMALSGCIAIPIAIPQERPYIDATEAHLQPGVTTSSDVIAVFGPPQWRSDSQWIYRNARLGFRWLVCAGAYSSGDCGTTDRGSTDYFLLATFSDDVLSAYSVQSQTDLCDSRKLCFAENLVSLAAHELLDAASKRFQVADDGCNVYVFPRRSGSASKVSVDDDYFGDLVSADSFYHFELDAGPHRVEFENAIATMRGGSAEIDCQDGTTHFLRIHSSAIANATIVKTLSEKQGLREIRKRWRAEPNNDFTPVSAKSLRDGEVRAFHDRGNISVYEYDDEGSVVSFGSSSSDGGCVAVRLIADYRLSPHGGTDALTLRDARDRPVELISVCNANGDCRLPALIGTGSCNLTAADEISFDTPRDDDDRRVLIIEPPMPIEAEETQRDGFFAWLTSTPGIVRPVPIYQEIWYGSADDLADEAECSATTCRMNLNALREFND